MNTWPTYEDVLNRRKIGRQPKYAPVLREMQPGEVREFSSEGIVARNVAASVRVAAKRAGIPIQTAILGERLYVARLRPEDVKR